MALREILLNLAVEVDSVGENRAADALKNIKTAAKVTAAAFAAIAAGKVIFDLVADVAALGDEIAKTSKRLGVNAQAMQELQFVANGAGVENAELADVMKDLSKNSFEAANGNENFAKMFKRLGVSVKDANGALRPSTELLADMADGMASLEDPTERVALSQTLLGGAGLKMIPFLEQGSEAIEAQRQRAIALGEVMSSDLLTSSELFVDTQREVKGAMQGLRNTIATQLLPILTPLVQKFTEFLIVLQGPLTRATKVIIAIFQALFLVLRTVADGWTLLIGLLPEAAQGLATVAAAVGLLVFILGLPVVLLLAIGAAIFLVIDDLITMGEGGESVIGTLITGFTDMIDELGGIGEAIVETLSTAFTFWVELLAKMLGASDETAQSISLFFKQMWSDTIDFMTKMFDDFLNVVLNPIQSVVSLFGDDGPAKTAGRIGQAGSVSAGGGALAAPAGAGGGNNSVTSNTEIKIEAGGVSDPKALTDMMAKRVDSIMEQRNRQAAQSFLPAPAS